MIETRIGFQKPFKVDKEKITSQPNFRPPLKANLNLAKSLCQELCSEDVRILPFCNTGWSPNDTIKTGAADTAWIVKAPRSIESKQACMSEGIKARWAGEASLGPKVKLIDQESGAFVMECVSGYDLLEAQAIQRLPEVISLLRNFHVQPAPSAFKRFDPFALARKEHALACAGATLPSSSLNLIQQVINASEESIGESMMWGPCHNDFAPFNIMSETEGRLWCIDFEFSDLCDPMWDVGFLAANIDIDAALLASSYGVPDEGHVRKARAFQQLANALLASWASRQGPQWHARVEWRLECLWKTSE